MARVQHRIYLIWGAFPAADVRQSELVNISHDPRVLSNAVCRPQATMYVFLALGPDDPLKEGCTRLNSLAKEMEASEILGQHAMTGEGAHATPST